MLTERETKRTIAAFALQGILYFVGVCFYDVNTVLPVFIEAMTGKVELAGLASTIKQCSTLIMQLLVGTYIVRVRHVPRYIGVCLLISYSMPLVIALALFTGAGGMTAAAVTLFAVAITWIFDGVMVIGYYDLLARTVDTLNRGRVLGLMQTIGGAGAMAGAVIIKRILDMNTSLNSRYGLIFSIGGIILIPAALCMFFAKDTPRREPEERYSLIEQLKKIPLILKENKGFRRVIYAQMLFLGAMLGVPYVLIMCGDVLKMSGEMVSSMLSIQVFGSLAGGLFSVFISPRFGSRTTVILFCIFSVIGSVFGILAAMGIQLWGASAIITVAVCGISTASWAGFISAMLDASGGKDAHLYMLINSITTLPMSIAPFAGGVIVKSFGFTALFSVSLILACAAMAVSLTIKKGALV